MTNHTLQKQLFQSGALIAALSVVLGAFGSHGLKEQLTPNDFAVFETGVRYQFYHAFALLLMAAFMRRLRENIARQAFYLFVAGIVIFSGSLYVLSTRSLWIGDSVKWIGGITPIGGLCLIGGWLLLAYKGYKASTYNGSTTPVEKKMSRDRKEEF